MLIICLISYVAKGKLFVSLTFDDGLTDHYGVYQTLQDCGMKATFYINSGRLDKLNRLTKQQVQVIGNAGHEIGGHTINHVNLPTLTSDQQVAEICGDKNNIRGVGFNATSFALPFGANFPDSKNVSSSCGYTSIRQSGGIQTPFDCAGCPLALTLPATQPYLLRSITYRLDYGLDYVIKPIQKALQELDQNKFYWIILVFHQVSNSTVYTAIPQTDFDTLLYFLKNNSIAVVKVHDVIHAKDLEQLYQSVETLNPTTNHHTSTFNSSESTESLASLSPTIFHQNYNQTTMQLSDPTKTPTPTTTTTTATTTTTYFPSKRPTTTSHSQPGGGESESPTNLTNSSRNGDGWQWWYIFPIGAVGAIVLPLGVVLIIHSTKYCKCCNRTFAKNNDIKLDPMETVHNSSRNSLKVSNLEGFTDVNIHDHTENII